MIFNVRTLISYRQSTGNEITTMTRGHSCTKKTGMFVITFRVIKWSFNSQGVQPQKVHRGSLRYWAKKKNDRRQRVVWELEPPRGKKHLRQRPQSRILVPLRVSFKISNKHSSPFIWEFNPFEAHDFVYRLQQLEMHSYLKRIITLQLSSTVLCLTLPFFHLHHLPFLRPLHRHLNGVTFTARTN